MEKVIKWIADNGHKVAIWLLVLLHFWLWASSGISPADLLKALQACAQGAAG